MYRDFNSKMCSDPDILLLGASGRTSARKVVVLRGYFELSGPSIHRIVADVLSMMIPGAFGV